MPTRHLLIDEYDDSASCLLNDHTNIPKISRLSLGFSWQATVFAAFFVSRCIRS